MIDSFNGQRVVFGPGQQNAFLRKIKNILEINDAELAKMLGVSVKSLANWRKEKYYMSLEAVTALCDRAKIRLPKEIKIIDKYWYARVGGKIGGKITYSRYGQVGGDSWYRKEKWLEWWKKEGKYRKNSVTSPLPIKTPPKSPLLAEFAGIMLGDGGITKRQATITLHKEDDIDFAEYVKDIISELFKIIPKLYLRNKKGVIDIVISRSELIKYLNGIGLPIGNKVVNQVDVPDWIKKSKNLRLSCLRGLFDTDGSIYIDKHKLKGKIYLNCGMVFTNRSLPLLSYFKKQLEMLGFNPTQSGYSIFLRREQQIISYFKKVGSKNPKHRNKLNTFLKNKYGEVPKWS